jgi:sialic acid synthase SpsE
MVFVIAEIGVNWNGDLQLVEEMVFKAKKIGCDAVKFQSFTKELVKEHPKWELLMKSSISENNIEQINNICKKIGIEWFCTPMYVEAVKLLEPYVNRYKVRFSDGIPIIQNKKSEIFDAILKTKKDIIISSQHSPKNCQHYNNSKIKWLYCVPKYPCSVEDLDFKKIKDFDGYSNHFPDIIAPITSCILGVEIIEIHITSSKSKDYVDNPVSFDYKELQEMIKFIRMSEQIKK